MSMKRSFGLLLLLCVLALPSFANLITNGDFETPVVPVGGFFNYNTGSTLITGWTVVGRQVSIVSGSYFSNGATFPAQNGVQWLDLTGDLSNSLGEGVEQSVPTIAGHTYQLVYYVGNVSAPGYGVASTVNISINATPTFSDTNSTASPTLLVWQQFTHTFTATGSSTLLDFLNGDPPNDNSNAIDNLMLTDLGVGTVPEPTSLLLLASGGVVGLGALRRRFVS